jgi:hypothetical protein
MATRMIVFMVLPVSDASETGREFDPLYRSLVQ